MTLKVTEKKLRKALEEAEQSLDMYPQSHSRVAGVARCLRWLGDPEAAGRFREAAEMVRPPDDPAFLLGLGNYLRLAGDDEEARSYLEQAYALYREEYDRKGFSERYMLECALLLGQDEDLEEIARKERRDYLETRLARARLTGDAKLAAQVAEGYAQDIRQTRVRLGASAPTTTEWDFYEMALRMRATLEEGAPDPNSRPLDLARWAAENPPSAAPPPKAKLSRDEVQRRIEEGTGRNEEADLSNTDLSGFNLSNEDLESALLVDADCRGTDFSGTILIEASFDGADLRGARLDGAWLAQVVLRGANLEGVDLSGARDQSLAWADLSGARATGANLSGLDLSGATLIEANLSGADLSHADLRGADLSGANLTSADLREATLDEANLHDAILDGALR